MDGIPRQPTVKKTSNTVKDNQEKSNFSAIAGIGKNSKPAKYWQQVVANFKETGKMMLYTNLLNTNAVEINDMTVGIEFPKGMTSFEKAVLEKSENISEISNQISIACGKEMHIKYIDTKPQEKDEMTEEQELSSFASGFDIPFDIIE